MASIDQILAGLQTVVDRLTAARQALDEAAELTREVHEAMLALGALGVADRIAGVLERIEEGAAKLAEAKAMAQEAIALTLVAQGGAQAGNSVGAGGAPPTSPPPTSPSLTVPPPAGRWEVPATPRYHGDPFNEQYERWVRESTGGPPDREYRVEHRGRVAWFDTKLVEVRGGVPTEVLVDAKGRYAQFIDDETGDWKSFWTKSKQTGRAEMIDTAERQVYVANGRPVEWHCAEEQTARALRAEFRRNPALAGKIRAVYKPMPGQEG